MATRLELEIKEWHERIHGTVDGPATYRKLLEEVGELGEAIMRDDASAVFEEAGDVGIVLAIIVQKYCDPPSLGAAMACSLAKIKERSRRGRG